MPSFHGRFSNPSDLSHLKLSEASVKALQDVCLTMLGMVMMNHPAKKKTTHTSTLCLTPIFLKEGLKKNFWFQNPSGFNSGLKIGFLLVFFGGRMFPNFPISQKPSLPNLAHSCRTWVPRWGHWCHPGNSKVSTCWKRMAALHLDLPNKPPPTYLMTRKLQNKLLQPYKKMVLKWYNIQFHHNNFSGGAAKKLNLPKLLQNSIARVELQPLQVAFPLGEPVSTDPKREAFFGGGPCHCSYHYLLWGWTCWFILVYIYYIYIYIY